MRQRLEITSLNIFKELKEAMCKEQEESMGMRSHYECSLLLIGYLAVILFLPAF